MKTMADHIGHQIQQHITELFQNYDDFNSEQIDELYDEPSALDFMRYVAQNRPFVVRGGCKTWDAVQKWNAEYLNKIVGDHDVNVAITPLGNADSVISMPDGTLSFVKPLEQPERFSSALSFIQTQEVSSQPSTPIRYAQTQNDNLRHEYAALFHDVPTSISFARIALQKDPDAINFWLGNSRSVTALHKDHYENVYAQIRGRKHFVLLPPHASPGVNETLLPGSTYRHAPSTNGDGPGSEQVEKPTLEPILDNPSAPDRDIPVAIWDPDSPEDRATPFSRLVPQVRVTLEEGDLLYLPAMWYHKVAQSCGEEGFCCAVNYWYDLDFGGGFWAGQDFVRSVGGAVARWREDQV